jgi:kynurenine formamidase
VAGLDRSGTARPDVDGPVHKILLSRGVLIAEHLTGLASLSGQRVEIIIGALNVEGADGAPARIFARPLEAQAPGSRTSK